MILRGIRTLARRGSRSEGFMVFCGMMSVILAVGAFIAGIALAAFFEAYIYLCFWAGSAAFSVSAVYSFYKAEDNM